MGRIRSISNNEAEKEVGLIDLKNQLASASLSNNQL